MMAWLKDAPIYTPDPDNEAVVCAFVDTIITCKQVDTMDDPVLAYLVRNRQTHRHTRTCWKKGVRHGVKICRFNIPFFPMDQTRVIHPFVAVDDLDDAELELKKKYTEDGKKIRKYLDENLATLQNSSMKFNEFLAVLDMTLDDYLKSVQASVSCSKVMLRRAVNEVLINNYNPLILKMHRANIDLQFILDAYACCIYIVDYINKSDKGMTKILEKVLSDGVEEGSPTETILRNLTSKYYNVKEVSAQEAAYNLLQLRKVETSAKTIFIPTGPEKLRSRILKPKVELQKLPSNSTDIYVHGWVEHYQRRPESLNHLNLAEFCSSYEFSKKGS